MAPESRALQASRAKVGLSTASVYPESTAHAFELAAKLGYDDPLYFSRIFRTVNDVSPLQYRRLRKG